MCSDRRRAVSGANHPEGLISVSVILMRRLSQIGMAAESKQARRQIA